MTLSELERLAREAQEATPGDGKITHYLSAVEPSAILALIERCRRAEALADVLDDEYLRSVAGYGYDVPRIHEAIAKWRAGR